MERQQFTFYESFFKAISRIKKKSDRCDAYDAICEYALYETHPDLDQLADAAAIAFELSKPNLDASRRKSNSGKKGGSRKQAASKPEASGKQEQGESKNERENEIENDSYISPGGDITRAAVAAVLSAYLDKITPTPSQRSLEELKGYVELMGQECCLRAIDIALDEKVAKWSYIRKILETKASQGVRCLADWDRLEAERRERFGTAGDTGVGAGKDQGRAWGLSAAEL